MAKIQRTRIVPSNPLRADPTRTATLRRLVEANLRKRFSALKRSVFELIVTEDAFGLTVNPLKIFNQLVRDWKSGDRPETLNQRFAFATQPQQLVEFQKWLAEQLGEKLEVKQLENPEEQFMEQFIQQGYEKGAGRAFDDTRKAVLQTDSERVSDFYDGTKEEFLRASFAQPVQKEKVRVLATRAMTDLKGVSEAVATQLQRTLADGLVQGQGPRQIARTMAATIDKVGKRRAELIARTEIIRAHAEGQLDAMERLGVEEVGAQVEWSTAGDQRVCPLCKPLDGVVMKLKEARGIIPRHPQCRCAWVPANVGESQSGQKRSKAEVQAAIGKSIRAEIPKKSKRTLAEQKNLTPWVGADKTIAAKRPKQFVAPTDAPKPRPSVAKVEPRKVERKKPAIKKVRPTEKKPVEPKPVKKKLTKTEELQKQLEEKRAARKKAETEAKAAQAKLAETKRKKAEGDRKKKPGKKEPILERIKENESLAATQTRVAALSSDTKEIKKLRVEEDKSDAVAKKRVAEYTKAQGEWSRDNPPDSRGETTSFSQTPEGKKAVARLKDSQTTRRSIGGKIADLEAAQVQKAHDILSLDSEERLAIETRVVTKAFPGRSVKPTKEHTRKIREADEFLESITKKRPAAESMRLTSIQLKSGARASHVGGAIRTSSTSDKGTVVHELTHGLEGAIPGAARNSNEFLQSRIAKSGSKTIKLKDVFPDNSYADDETGNEDGFSKAFEGRTKSSAFYAGKLYDGRDDTEVFSMGAQLLHDDPIGFANRDPEYFKFVVGNLNGELE